MRSSCLDEEDQVGDTTANIMRFDIFGMFKMTSTTTPCGVKYNILWGKNWAIVITDNVLVYSYLAFSLGRLHIIFSTFIYRQITLCNIRSSILCVFNDDDHVIVIWHVCQVLEFLILLYIVKYCHLFDIFKLDQIQEKCGLVEFCWKPRCLQ